MKLQGAYKISKTKRTCNYDENVNKTIDDQETSFTTSAQSPAVQSIVS